MGFEGSKGRGWEETKKRKVEDGKRRAGSEEVDGSG
jgi:hypothetical protein